MMSHSRYLNEAKGLLRSFEVAKNLFLWITPSSTKKWKNRSFKSLKMVIHSATPQARQSNQSSKPTTFLPEYALGLFLVSESHFKN
ncbi:unnamed protein product [Hymenolepis diminuta]|uniref:Uncharacterized protein n=1 Tax=Hymenolepis diminuta TaxID=6216 RepID=A0A564YJ63_HYMDI|nr:unnamed protein product [Hymenolepis diminuta]